MGFFKRLFGGEKEPAFEGKDIRRFINELTSDNGDVRERAFQALKNIGDAAVEPLIESLEHTNLMVRRQAAEALGMIHTRICVQSLLNVFSDPRPEMFRRANYVLWLIGEPSISSLVEKLQDDNPKVRSRAAIALGEMIHRRRADPSDHHWLDPSAIEATDTIRDDIHVEAVKSQAKSPLEKVLQDKDVNVRKQALITLEKGYGEPSKKKEVVAKKRESVTKRKKVETGVPPIHVKEGERDEKRAEWLSKADKLKKEGQHEKAIEYWSFVIGANLDRNGYAHYLKGCTLAELDRPEEAVECLKDSLQLDPDQSSCLLELGRVFHMLGRWNEARSAFKKVVTMSFGVYGDDNKAMKWLQKMDEEGH